MNAVARVLSVIAVLQLLLCAACSGGPGSSCRSSGECTSGLACAGPDDPHACGIPPRQGCAATSDCQGEVCSAIYDPCSPTGVGSECRPRCSGGSCAPGFRCNAGGACEPLPCDEGYRCPAYQRCDPAAAHAKGPVYRVTQGCVNIACTADAECPATRVCVNGFCQDGPGTCRENIAVP